MTPKVLSNSKMPHPAGLSCLSDFFLPLFLIPPQMQCPAPPPHSPG